MTQLNNRGIVAIVEIVVYIPLALLSVSLLIKYGFKREGWVYLLILSIIRIAGGITYVMVSQQAHPSTSLQTTAVILETSGVSPLLVATVGFLGTVKLEVFSDGHFIHKALRLMSLLSTIALILTISGGSEIGSNEGSDNVDKINSGNKERHIGAILFVVQFGLNILATFFMWSNVHLVMKHRRTLLKAITATLPFLAVRVLYTVLSSFSPLGIPGVDTGSQSLAKFNSSTGTFGIWLFMAPIMEFVVIVIYVSVGIMTPLQNDYRVASNGSRVEDGTQLYPSAYAPDLGHTQSASTPSNISLAQQKVGVPQAYLGSSVYAPRPDYA